MAENGFSYEIIFVDDGSTDESWGIAARKNDISDCAHNSTVEEANPASA